MTTKHQTPDTKHRFYVGTSGWQYGHWKGIFYPENLKTKDWLQFYTQHLDTLELNVTFYRQVRQSTFQKWYDGTPPGFLFSVKMSRFITHLKRLKVEAESMNRFLEDVRVLKEKLGVILIQLPPSFKFDRPLMADFFTLLDPTCKYTVEARNESFINDDFFSMLHEQNISWCIAESAGRYPYREAVTASFVYVRLHGRTDLYASNYSDDELKVMADKVRGWGRDTYVYFDNDFGGFAVRNGMTLKHQLAQG